MSGRPVRIPAGKPILTGRPDRTHKAVMEPPPLREGQVRCPACRNGVRTVKSGALARHRDLFGGYCGNWSTELTVSEIPLLPVVIETGTVKNGECRECGKWLPGERSLCGRCSVLRSA